MSRHHYSSNYQAWPNQHPQWQYQQQQQQQPPQSEYLHQQFIYQPQQRSQPNYYQQPQAQYEYMEYSSSPYNENYDSIPFVRPQNSMSTPQNVYHMTQQLPQVSQYAHPQVSQQQS